MSSLGSYAANYNGFNGTVYKSPWSTWTGKASGVKVGILIDGLTTPTRRSWRTTWCRT